VAKFGLPVRGFRDARGGSHAGPGHELDTGRNVLMRDFVMHRSGGDGSGDPAAAGAPSGEGSGGARDDA
jgi:NAD+ kinase